MLSDGITLIPHFMKIGQMFLKSKGRDTETDRAWSNKPTFFTKRDRLKFSSYLTEKALRPHYKDQMVNAVQRNNCL